ncbi:MAG: thiamine pyrophosphate-dependent enzyme [Clostridia bacterium]|nr:thiamine pyrophosphate-dependent enzyme [Clostridia bacterium]
MVAYQLANRNKVSKVFCLDGDGSILMHMGSLAVLGKYPVDNLVHVCLNNEAHESVGGMPTGAAGISYGGFAEIAGYKKVYCVKDEVELEEALDKIRKKDEMTFLDISVSLESRANLGRPAESTKENKEMFMKHEGVVG